MTLTDFDTLAQQHRVELHAYCYRMLGSLQDAEDACQETLLSAWRGLAQFEQRSSLRSWLYRIATNACLRIIEQRPPRLLPQDRAAPTSSADPVPQLEGPIWLEPFPGQLDTRYAQLESIELAFIAALQHLPANQRAVLILREALEFSAAEAAELLDTSVAAVNSALQRARDTVSCRIPPLSQQATLRQLGPTAQQQLVQAYVTAWATRDVAALLQLLTDDAQFSMPPLPVWYRGLTDIRHFLSQCIFVSSWRLTPVQANAQLAFLCQRTTDEAPSALNVLSLRGSSISHITAFLEPSVLGHFRVS